MVGAGRVHDRFILDIIESLDPIAFSGDVWRVARRGRDPLRGSAAHGRWSAPGEFEVLYTSVEEQGALAEIGYRLSLEPVWPSRMEHDVHRITARTYRTLHFADVSALTPLGVDVAHYESFDYGATQAVAAAAHFLEFDGLLVPSARAACANLVIFMDRVASSGSMEICETRPVDWAVWRRASRRG